MPKRKYVRRKKKSLKEKELKLGRFLFFLFAGVFLALCFNHMSKRNAEMYSEATMNVLVEQIVDLENKHYELAHRNNEMDAEHERKIRKLKRKVRRIQRYLRDDR